LVEAGVGSGEGSRRAALATMRAQRAPYRLDQVALLDLAVGQAELRIEFAASSPLGLLTSGVLQADLSLIDAATAAAPVP
jgi:hypothetical protein